MIGLWATILISLFAFRVSRVLGFSLIFLVFYYGLPLYYEFGDSVFDHNLFYDPVFFYYLCFSAYALLGFWISLRYPPKYHHISLKSSFSRRAVYLFSGISLFTSILSVNPLLFFTSSRPALGDFSW